MANKPDKEETSREKHPAEMTDEELMDALFDPKVRKELQKLAREHRPKEPED